MRKLFALLFFLAGAAVPAWGQDGAGRSPCLAAAQQAEAEAGIPPGLLAAIGRIESGRWNPASNQVEAWPWTANAAGIGRYFASQTEALAGVRQAQANGYLSIDVGCFQVNLMHHPNAFTTLEEAFEPLANARYAARFLSTLRTGSGSWNAAIGQYHSATPGVGEPYRQRVLANWQGGVMDGPGDDSGGSISNAPRPLRQASALRSMAPPQPDRTAATAQPDRHVLVIHTSFSSRTLVADPHVLNVGAMFPRRRG